MIQARSACPSQGKGWKKASEGRCVCGNNPGNKARRDKLERGQRRCRNFSLLLKFLVYLDRSWSLPPSKKIQERNF